MAAVVRRPACLTTVPPPGLVSSPGGLILDIDGVLLRGTRPLPGLKEFFALARTRPYMLVTNNSLVSARDCQATLSGMGVDVPAAAILTVSDAAARQLAAGLPTGSPVLVLGSPAMQAAWADGAEERRPA